MNTNDTSRSARATLLCGYNVPNSRHGHYVTTIYGGYMMRDWVITSLPNPATSQKRSYNFHHSSNSTTVERAIVQEKVAQPRHVKSLPSA